MGPAASSVSETEPVAGDPVHRCVHCGFPLEEPEPPFCCHGCEIAAGIVAGAGLERYYRDRTAYAPRPGGLQGAWEQVPWREHADGTREVRLAIDGLRCASCVWLTEHVLAGTPGAVDAHVSYGTGRASLRWDPDRTDLTRLAGRIAALGYRPRILGEESQPDRALMIRLGVAVFGALNIMLVHVALYAGWLGPMEPRFESLFKWTALALATPLAMWCAEPFFLGAWQGLRRAKLHMDLPIALAVLVLYVHGVVATLGGGETYLDSLGMLVALLLAGRLLESRGRRRAAEAAVTLGASVPSQARRWSGSALETVPAEGLAPGDLIELAVGEEAAADGVVERGRGFVDRGIVTGESEPSPVEPGDTVVAGSSLVEGGVSVRVEAVGEETLVGRMAEEVRSAVDRRTRTDGLDRVAPWFTAATLIIAGVVWWSWWLVEGVATALPVTVSVLVVACPCALALSRPLSFAAGLGAAARRGLLMRSGDGLMELARVDVAALDKTGTVTAGERQVVESPDHVIRIASGLERSSIHPIGRAVVEEARARGIPLPAARDVEETPGEGVRGVVDGLEWVLKGDGSGTVGLYRQDAEGLKKVGTIGLEDRLRPTSGDALDRLRSLGVSTTLLSGDASAVVQRIGDSAGVDGVRGGQSPAEKAKWIEDRRTEGRRVLFAGDGINDGPALAAADVGLAMRGGASSSLLVADGVVVSESLESIATGIQVARVCRDVIRGSQARSIAYNVLAVGAAAAGFVNPLVAAILMPASSGMVLWSASRVESRVRRLTT